LQFFPPDDRWFSPFPANFSPAGGTSLFPLIYPPLPFFHFRWPPLSHPEGPHDFPDFLSPPYQIVFAFLSPPAPPLLPSVFFGKRSSPPDGDPLVFFFPYKLPLRIGGSGKDYKSSVTNGRFPAAPILKTFFEKIPLFALGLP